MKFTWMRLAVGLAVGCLVLGVAENASAQTGKLTGVVVDAESGAPLEGAQIILQGTGISALTGANGRYFLVNVPPAAYVVVVRRIGYQSREVRNVLVQIDVTRTLDFQVSPAAAVGLETIVVTAQETPLVQPGVTGSGSNISAEEISALPVTNIQGVLSLQQGFLEIPHNTDIVSFTDTRRNPLSPVSIRGGRGGETLTQIDNIPINNFVFGGPAFDITNEAVQQVDFQRGGFEPQYGNALSGIINIATREGGANLAGAMSYQTSAVGGALGSTSDDLSGFNLYQGYISGPVPGTSGNLRFMVAGRAQSGADRVLNFDDDVNRASTTATGNNVPHALDLFAGWRALGYDETRDGIAKVTYYFAPTMKLNVTGIRYQRQRLPFDFDWLLTGFNALDAAGLNIEDTLSLAGGNNTQRPTGLALYGDVVSGSIQIDRQLYSAQWTHTLGRWAYTISAGQFEQQRQTCNFFQGVCLGDRFADVNFSGRFVAPITQAIHPAGGTDEFFGGEHLTTQVGRVDIQGQATDHHNLQFGVFYQRHDLVFEEFRNQGVNNVVVIPGFYQDTPWDGAVYLQDRIEYDFLTVKVGARFDFGQAGGLFFANPRDPTNGTTAREVCDGDVSSINGGNPFASGAITGFDACTLDRTLLDSAATLAQFDDFVSSQSRTQFSPRIGVSFPLSERSLVFFNFGRYSQNPLYNNLFQNTGIGTTAGETGGNVCGSDAVVPGTTTCHPIIFSDIYTVSFLGNPNLQVEKTTSYEMGFATEIGNDYALQVTAFSKDQFGLSGLRQGGRDNAGTRLFDVGATYGGQSQYDYFVIVNQDFQTVRGFEASLRRRLSNYWGFSINYGLTQATTNASAPDQEFQRTAEEGDPSNLQEIRSQLDQPHNFNASVNFRAGPQDSPFGVGILDALARNANASVTVQASSGLPYTPTLSFTGFGDNQLARNSGRAPSRFNINTQVGKSFNLSNVRAGAFVRISNLLDGRDCVQVFASTGRCDGGTVDQSRDRQGNTVGEGTVSTYFDRPQFFSSGREISAGLRLDF